MSHARSGTVVGRADPRESRPREPNHPPRVGAVAATGVELFLRRYRSDLRDGERQRVMIARVHAQTPHLMVFGEITAFLDLPSRVEIMALLRFQAKQKQVVLLSSHTLDMSLQLPTASGYCDGAGGFFAILLRLTRLTKPE